MRIEYTEAQMNRRIEAFNQARQMTPNIYNAATGQYAHPDFNAVKALANKILSFVEGVPQEDAQDLMTQLKSILCDKK